MKIEPNKFVGGYYCANGHQMAKKDDYTNYTCKICGLDYGKAVSRYHCSKCTNEDYCKNCLFCLE